MIHPTHLDVNLIQELPSEHFEDEYIESNFGYTDQTFEKFFDEEIMLLNELIKRLTMCYPHVENLIPSH